MKQIKYILSALLVVMLCSSCENDVEDVITEDAKPRVSALASVSDISEANSPSFDITISFDRPIKTTTTFAATQVGGTASNLDYEVSTATVPAYQKSATMTVTVFDDIEVEGVEDLQLQIEATSISDSYEVVGNPIVTVNILNSESSDLLIRLEWDDIYLDAGEHEHHFCDMDLDLEIYDADFNYINGSYSDCPEELIISTGDLPDGSYFIVPEFWSTAGATPPATVMNIPAKMTFANPGIVLETDDISDLFNTDTGGFRQGNPDWAVVKYVLTVSNSNYTVADADTGEIVFAN